jgi:PKD repeat protein
MRSIYLLAATSVIVTLATACGDGGGTQPDPTPVAGFTGGPCTVDVDCTFTDTSSDPQGSSTITSRVWNFGDGSADITASALTQSHRFGTAGTFNVKLTVTDNTSRTDVQETQVTVNAGTPNNVAPVASFAVPTTCTAGADCTFTSTSTDANGNETIVSTTWAFGDGNTGSGTTVTNQYESAGQYSVVLTVTDNQGAPGTITQTVTIAPAAAQDCTPSTTSVLCLLDVTQRSTVNVTLVSRSCEIGGNEVVAHYSVPDQTTLRHQTIFFNGCFDNSLNQAKTLLDKNGAPMVFQPGAQIQLEFRRGDPDPEDPTPIAPAARLQGGHPSWEIDIEDGGNPSELDFDDLVLSVQATAAP